MAEGPVTRSKAASVAAAAAAAKNVLTSVSTTTTVTQATSVTSGDGQQRTPRSGAPSPPGWLTRLVAPTVSSTPRSAFAPPGFPHKPASSSDVTTPRYSKPTVDLGATPSSDTTLKRVNDAPCVYPSHQTLLKEEGSPALGTRSPHGPEATMAAFFQLMQEERRQERAHEERRRHEDRAMEERRIQREEERRRREEERREADKVMEREREQARQEREEVKRIEEKQLEQERFAQLLTTLRADQINTSASSASGSDGRSRPRPRLSMPVLQAGDDMDEFLRHFEAVAESFVMDDGEKKLHLMSSLTDRARRVLIRMPASSTYPELQLALKKAYSLTPEAYRKKFREARKQVDETFAMFGERLTQILDTWLELEGMPLKDLVLLEQLCAGVGTELTIRIREQKPDSFSQAIEIADVFADARRMVKGQGGLPFTRTSQTTKDNRSGNVRGTQPPGGAFKTPTMGSETNSAKPGDSKAGACFYCGKAGHMRKECRKLQADKARRARNETGSARVAVLGESTAAAGQAREPGLPTFHVVVEGHTVEAVRDTGATHVCINRDLVPADAPQGGLVSLTGLTSQFKVSCPKVLIEVSTPYHRGKIWAVAVPNAVCPVLIGNTLEAESGQFYEVSSEMPAGIVAAVVTRGAARAQKLPVLRPVLDPFPQGVALGVTPDDLHRMQEEDPTLAKAREVCGKPAERGKATFTKKKDLLHRKFTKGGASYTQLVVPASLRSTVLKIGHDMPMAGHLAAKRTLERIRHDFYWPGMAADVRRYCRTCDVCQRTTPKGHVKRVPLGSVPLVEEPFSKVGVDLIGPIKPRSSEGHQYVLVAVDYATRYPEAVALKKIDAETVAEALWQIWTRVGVPREVLTDLGTQFVSEVMRSVHRLLGVKARNTTPYHAQANGLVERFNGTLKQMIKRLAQDHPKDWHRYIPAVLFAYREVPQESMRFSPFELLYGRTVRGPMAVLRDLWANDGQSQPVLKPEVEYVADLRNRLASTCEVAQQHLGQASKRYARAFNRKAKERWFDAGDEVLLLLPVKKNKLQLAWRGPYTVIERVGDWDYKIQVGGKEKLFHANLLKRYLRRDASSDASASYGTCCAGLAPAVVEEVCEETAAPHMSSIPFMSLKQEESFQDVQIGEGLTKRQKAQVLELCEEFQDVLTDVPLKCKLGECTLQLDTVEPVRVKQYPLPHSQTSVIKEEVQTMLDMGVIERAASPYSAPIVLVKKKDGKVRFCIDYRRLNKHLVFDSEPIPDTEQIFGRLGPAKFFTKIDLTKGYWQIPMHLDHRQYTAFTTPQGQFVWRVMPFGLKTAGAVFTRVMRRLLERVGDPNIQNFIDDIIVATVEWDQHLESLRALFQGLREAQLAARPKKCLVGHSSVPFLGHVVSEGEIHPEEDKVEKVSEAVPPRTKKELRAFLGLAGYYRKFVPNFATIALPLTNKTRAKEPDKVRWDDECQKSFDKLKAILTSEPVLRLPNDQKPFILRTDASGVGLGAVLLQGDQEGVRPVAYASKKLTEAERRYHTIEQECLAVVWGIRKFYPHLYGRHFVLESDHHPLTYLHRIRPVSRRLMGWALELQSHSFEFRHIKGEDNHGADYLSRAHTV